MIFLLTQKKDLEILFQQNLKFDRHTLNINRLLVMVKRFLLFLISRKNHLLMCIQIFYKINVRLWISCLESVVKKCRQLHENVQRNTKNIPDLRNLSNKES